MILPLRFGSATHLNRMNIGVAEKTRHEKKINRQGKGGEDCVLYLPLSVHIELQNYNELHDFVPGIFVSTNQFHFHLPPAASAPTTQPLSRSPFFP